MNRMDIKQIALKLVCVMETVLMVACGTDRMLWK